MQAIILAAGMGTRLKDLTVDKPKCLVEVNGEPLLKRMLEQLDGLDLSKIIIVIGYKGNKLMEFVTGLNIRTPIIYVDNDIYEKTNNIYSLALTQKYLQQEDSILLESDLIFDAILLEELVRDCRKTLAIVDKYEPYMSGTVVKIDGENNIEQFIKNKDIETEHIDSYFKTVNIYKFSKDFMLNFFVPFLEAYLKTIGSNDYYEYVLRVIAFLDKTQVQAKCLSGQKWYEIDDAKDIEAAESIFFQ